jgi:hypothetical protein
MLGRCDLSMLGLSHDLVIQMENESRNGISHGARPESNSMPFSEGILGS